MPPPLVDVVDQSFPLPEHVARKVNPFHRLMRSYLGIAVILVVILAIAIQPLIAVAPTILVMTWAGVFRTDSIQRFFDYSTGLYLSVVVSLLELLLGIKMRSFGHQERFKRRSVLLMNHVCHFDWMFSWGVVERQGNLCYWKSVTKDMIKKVPILGICMQYMCHIFITRRWQDDEKEFRQKLHYFNALDLPVQLLLFPEGGDLTRRTKDRSDSFADTHNLPRYEYCLHPRVTGFLYTLKALRCGQLDAVYDVTIGYPDALAKTEADFLRHMPREIHFHVKHYSAKDLPTDDEELVQWLYERWREKEKMLELFYTHKRFMEPISGEERNGMEMNIPSKALKQNGHTELKPSPEVLIPKNHSFSFGAIAFYGCIMIVFSYILWVSWLWRGWVVILTVFTFYKGYTAGIDTVLPNAEWRRIDLSYQQHPKHLSRAPSDGTLSINSNGPLQ